MRDGHCPKCGSHSVHVSTVVVPPKGRSVFNAIPITYSAWWGASSAPLKQYICVECGYVEQYVEDPEKLKEIAAKLPHVG